MREELSPGQAAARIGTSTRTVQRWITAGRLPAKRIGGRWRVASDALDALIRPNQGEEPLRTLFVANRGEIARRIARTAGRLGIRVVVPPADRASRANDAGGADRANAHDPHGTLDLLDIEAVVSAARTAGADALHPGYGFLAENADFAEAVIAAGIRWVGPPPAAIRAMGDKAGARRLAARLGVPVLPGYDDPDQSDDALAAAARMIGPPLLVKPTAGGGGKGMRVVRELAALPDALASARREAQAAFGDDRLILERFLEGPRHVEVQLLFDAHGRGVHLGERDCSVQRRHQKILEETPSPAGDPDLRRRLGDAALKLAGAVGYVSAGTCEFLLDDRDRFFFLEMNTRLQVEHPVTELVTGRDLVADQLRIAAGEPLGFDQVGADAAREAGGHAVEVRLYAEDAEAGFLPATGRVEALRWPVGEGIRIDAGIVPGTDVGDRFDPMLAKIVAGGRNRAEALERLARALDETVVLGLTTNLRFLRWLVRQPSVLDGQARIDTLERSWPPGEAAEWATIPDGAWQTAARLLLAEQASPPDRSPDPWAGGWRLNSARTARLLSESGERTVTLGHTPLDEVPLTAVRVGDTVHVDVDGRSVPFQLAPPPDVDRAVRAAAAHRVGGASEVTSPMPGAVLAVHVEPGTTVEAGDPIVTLEAMKMEHVVSASCPGTITDVLVRPTDQVARGQLLVQLE